jgi:general secretion pathway protein L
MNYLVIHLTRQEAVVARFSRSRGGSTFMEAARRPLEGGELPPLLEGLTAATGEERVVLALPPELVFLRELDLPITDRRRLREVVPLELTGETALESDNLQFDALSLADGKVLALWTSRDALASRIALLAEQGLEPEMVTASFCHWGELLPPAERTGVVAVTDGEALAVFREGNLLFCRPLVAAEGGAEVGQTLALLELGRGVRVTRVLLHGGAARRQEQFVATGPEDIEWLPLPPGGGVAAAFSADAATARDLAACYAVMEAMAEGTAVDFRSGTLAYTAGLRRARRRLLLPAILAGLLVLCFFAEQGLRYYLVSRDLKSLNASIGAIYREVFPTRTKAMDEVGELKSEIKRLGGGVATVGVLTVLKKVAEAKGEEVTGIFEAEIEGDQVRLKGDARSAQAVNDFKLRSAGIFSSTEVSEIKSRPDGSVTFSFRGTLKEGQK